METTPNDKLMDEDVTGVCLEINSLMAGVTLEAYNKMIASLPQMFADHPVKLQLILNIIRLNQRKSEEAAADLIQNKVHNPEEAISANNLEITLVPELEATVEGNLEIDEYLTKM